MRWGHSTVLWPGLPHLKHVMLLQLVDQSTCQSASCVGKFNFVKLPGVGDCVFSGGQPEGAGLSGIGHGAMLFFGTIAGWFVPICIVGSPRASCGVLGAIVAVLSARHIPIL